MGRDLRVHSIRKDDRPRKRKPRPTSRGWRPGTGRWLPSNVSSSRAVIPSHGAGLEIDEELLPGRHRRRATGREQAHVGVHQAGPLLDHNFPFEASSTYSIARAGVEIHAVRVLARRQITNGRKLRTLDAT